MSGSRRIVENFDPKIVDRVGITPNLQQMATQLGISQQEMNTFVTNIDKPLDKMNVVDFDNRILVLDKWEKVLSTQQGASTRMGAVILRTIALVLIDSRSRRSRLSGKEGFAPLAPLLTDLNLMPMWRVYMEILTARGVSETVLQDVYDNFQIPPEQLTAQQRSNRLRVLHAIKQTSYILTSHDKVLNTIVSTSNAVGLKKAYDDGMVALSAREQALTSLEAWKSRKAQREAQQVSWDQRYNQIFNSNQETRYWKNCAAAGQCWARNDFCVSDFGQGWVDDENQRACGFLNAGCQRRCKKSDSLRAQQATAQVTGERGPRPANFTEPAPVVPSATPPSPLSPAIHAVLNPDALPIFKAAHTAIDYLLDLYLQELYFVMSPSEIRIGLPVEKFIEFYKMLDADHTMTRNFVKVLEESIAERRAEIDNLITGVMNLQTMLKERDTEIAGLNSNIKQLGEKHLLDITQMKTDHQTQLANKDIDMAKLNADYERRLTEKEAERQAELKRLLDEQQAIRNQFEADAASLNSTIASLNAEIDELKKMMAQKELENNERVMGLRSEIESLKSQMEANIAEYTAEKIRLTEDIGKKQLEVAASAAELDAVRANYLTEKELLQADASDRVARVQEEMQKEIDDLNEIKTQYEQLQLDIEKQQQDMRKLQSAEKSLALQLETNKSSVNTLTIGLVITLFIIIILCILLWNRPSSA
jgi:hypothetical protein